MLWRENAWAELNAFAWVREVSALLPAGHQLDGIHKDRFDLVNMSYEGPVRRNSDCHICATGGTVQVKLQLQENSVVLAEFRYVAPATPPSTEGE